MAIRDRHRIVGTWPAVRPGLGHPVGVCSPGSRGQTDADSAGILCSGDKEEASTHWGMEYFPWLMLTPYQKKCSLNDCLFLIRSSCLEFCQHGPIFSELDLSSELLFQFRLKILSPANYVQLLRTMLTLDKNINEKIIPWKEDEFLWISWLVLTCCQYWVIELVYTSRRPQVY